MYRGRKVNSMEMNKTVGYDWTCMPAKLVTQQNVESFINMLGRTGIEEILVHNEPTSEQVTTCSRRRGVVDTDHNALWDDGKYRVRVRLTESWRIVSGAAMEVEEQGASCIRHCYQCTDTEVINRVLRHFRALVHLHQQDQTLNRVCDAIRELEREVSVAKADAAKAKAIARTAERVAMIRGAIEDTRKRVGA